MSTKGDKIYNLLRNEIISLKREPGEILKVIQLSNELNVSRSPVRDALMQLSKENLVDIIPQSGCLVSKIDFTQAEQERFIRKSLELSLMSNYSNCWDKTLIAKQKANIILQEQALADEAFLWFLALDNEFHSAFFSKAGLSHTWEIINSNTGSYQRLRMLSYKVNGITDLALKQHKQLIDFIEKKQTEKAIEIENMHVSKILEQIKEIITLFPNYFIKENIK